MSSPSISNSSSSSSSEFFGSNSTPSRYNTEQLTTTPRRWGRTMLSSNEAEDKYPMDESKDEDKHRELTASDQKDKLGNEGEIPKVNVPVLVTREMGNITDTKDVGTAGFARAARPCQARPYQARPYDVRKAANHLTRVFSGHDLNKRAVKFQLGAILRMCDESECKITRGLKQCSKCQVMRYCSTTCRKRHFKKGHAKECQILAKGVTSRWRIKELWKPNRMETHANPDTFYPEAKTKQESRDKFFFAERANSCSFLTSQMLTALLLAKKMGMDLVIDGEQVDSVRVLEIDMSDMPDNPLFPFFDDGEGKIQRQVTGLVKDPSTNRAIDAEFQNFNLMPMLYGMPDSVNPTNVTCIHHCLALVTKKSKWILDLSASQFGIHSYNSEGFPLVLERVPRPFSDNHHLAWLPLSYRVYAEQCIVQSPVESKLVTQEHMRTRNEKMGDVNFAKLERRFYVQVFDTFIRASGITNELDKSIFSDLCEPSDPTRDVEMEAMLALFLNGHTAKPRAHITLETSMSHFMLRDTRRMIPNFKAPRVEFKKSRLVQEITPSQDELKNIQRAPAAISATDAVAILTDLSKADALGEAAKTPKTTVSVISTIGATLEAKVAKTYTYAKDLAWTVDLVQMSVKKKYRKRGVLNKLLDELQAEMRRVGHWSAIYIEAVHEEWLIKSLMKRSNAVMMPGQPNSVYLMQ